MFLLISGLINFLVQYEPKRYLCIMCPIDIHVHNLGIIRVLILHISVDVLEHALG